MPRTNLAVRVLGAEFGIAGEMRRLPAYSPLSHSGYIVPGDQKSFVLPRLASPSQFWLRGYAR